MRRGHRREVAGVVTPRKSFRGVQAARGAVMQGGRGSSGSGRGGEEEARRDPWVPSSSLVSGEQAVAACSRWLAGRGGAGRLSHSRWSREGRSRCSPGRAEGGALGCERNFVISHKVPFPEVSPRTRGREVFRVSRKTSISGQPAHTWQGASESALTSADSRPAHAHVTASQRFRPERDEAHSLRAVERRDDGIGGGPASNRFFTC